MKKLVFTVIFCIFAIITAHAEVVVPDTIRVGLFYGSSAKENVTLEFDGQLVSYALGDVDGELAVTPGEGLIKADGTAYRGSIILLKDDNGKLTVINEVGLDDYTAAVLAKEMSPSFELEALKAQAVAARTYAVRNSGKHGKYGFDVCRSNDCQVYGGAEDEHERTVRAAQQTSGEVLVSGGALAETVYFATSGGHTESSEYVWGSDISYLKAISDEYEADNVYGASWTRELSPSQLEAAVTGLGNIIDVEITKTSPSGAVYEIKVVGDNGEKVFKNESCRTFLGYDVLLSQAYTVIKSGDGVTVETTGGTARVNGISVMSASGIAPYSGAEMCLMGGELQVAVISTPPQSDGYIFSGRGWGHLVGMSQNGANGMAAAGFDYQQILTHYYTGTEILKRSII